MAARIAALLAMLMPVLQAVDPNISYAVHTLTSPSPGIFSQAPASQVTLEDYRPIDIAADAAGNLYISGDSVRKVDAAGTIRQITANVPRSEITYSAAPSGDGGPAQIAAAWARALAAAPDGTLYLAQDDLRSMPDRIRSIAPDGVISTLTTEIGAFDLTLDPEGNLYANLGPTIYRITADGTVSHFGGTGNCESTGDGGPAAEAAICARDIAAAPNGSIYVAERDRVRRITPDGIIVAFAGTGERGFSGDGGPAIDAQFGLVTAVEADSAGNVYIADERNNRVRRVTPDGIIDTYAGSDAAPGESTGDGGPAIRASLNRPYELAAGPEGMLYIVETASNSRMHTIRVVDIDGTISTFAGCAGCYGDGGHVTFAEFGVVSGVARDLAGNLYIADRAAHRVRTIAPDGTVGLFAGTGQSGFTGDGGPATAASLSYPSGIAFDVSDNLYIADKSNHRIRRVTMDGRIDTIAGRGEYGYSGDGGPAVLARLANPEGIAFDAAGNLYIADFGNHVIRMVDAGGTITTVAGTGDPGFSGDGGAATDARLNGPKNLTFGPDGAAYVAEFWSHRIRRVSPDGVITTVAGIGDSNDFINLGDGGPATEAILRGPTDVAFDNDGQLVIADAGHRLVRTVDAGDIIDSLRTSDGRYLQAAFYSLLLADDGSIFADDTLRVVKPADAIPPEQRPFINWTGVVNSASVISGGVAPGEIVSIFGERLVPDGQGGSGLGTELGGTRVFIGRLPATLTYASWGQINAVVPFGIEGTETVGIRVERLGESSNDVTQAVLPVVPGLYFDSYTAASALNQNYSVNTWETPARPGEIMMLYATGFGQTDPPSEDGAINEAPLPKLRYPVTATLDGIPVAVHYAGPAPTLVAGAILVNIQTPSAFAPDSNPARRVELSVGGVPTQSEIVIYVE